MSVKNRIPRKEYSESRDEDSSGENEFVAGRKEREYSYEH